MHTYPRKRRIVNTRGEYVRKKGMDSFVAPSTAVVNLSSQQQNEWKSLFILSQKQIKNQQDIGNIKLISRELRDAIHEDFATTQSQAIAPIESALTELATSNIPPGRGEIRAIGLYLDGLFQRVFNVAAQKETIVAGIIDDERQAVNYNMRPLPNVDRPSGYISRHVNGSRREILGDNRSAVADYNSKPSWRNLWGRPVAASIVANIIWSFLGAVIGIYFGYNSVTHDMAKLKEPAGFHEIFSRYIADKTYREIFTTTISPLLNEENSLKKTVVNIVEKRIDSKNHNIFSKINEFDVALLEARQQDILTKRVQVLEDGLAWSDRLDCCENTNIKFWKRLRWHGYIEKASDEYMRKNNRRHDEDINLPEAPAIILNLAGIKPAYREKIEHALLSTTRVFIDGENDGLKFPVHLIGVQEKKLFNRSIEGGVIALGNNAFFKRINQKPDKFGSVKVTMHLFSTPLFINELNQYCPYPQRINNGNRR